MSIALHSSATRGLLAAGLALVGTFASFAATTTPAQAQNGGRSYSATLTAKLDAPRREVINGVIWNCREDTCTGLVDGARPLHTCKKVAKEFGAVSKFATPKGELSADDLQRCNATA